MSLWHSPTRRPLVAALALTLAATPLTACSQEPLPEPRPAAATDTPRPALTVGAAEGILSDTAALLVLGDEKKETELLGGRFTEPAWALRAGQYQADTLTEGRIAVPVISTSPEALYVSQAPAFPRVMMTITKEPEGANLPQLLTFEQNGPRDPYKLWAWAELFPGVTVPAMPSPQVGAVVLAPDAQGLKVTPQDAVARYVDTLLNPDGEHAGSFTPRDQDPFKKQVRLLQDEVGPTITAAGTVALSATPGSSAPLALATADGGALVLAEVRMAEIVRRTKAGSQLNLGGDHAAYLEGNGTVTGTVSFDYLGMVVLHIPAADAGDAPIEVLGSSRTLISANRDDSTNPG